MLGVRSGGTGGSSRCGPCTELPTGRSFMTPVPDAGDAAVAAAREAYDGMPGALLPIMRAEDDPAAAGGAGSMPSARPGTTRPQSGHRPFASPRASMRITVSPSSPAHLLNAAREAQPSRPEYSRPCGRGRASTQPVIGRPASYEHSAGIGPQPLAPRQALTLSFGLRRLPGAPGDRVPTQAGIPRQATRVSRPGPGRYRRGGPTSPGTAGRIRCARSTRSARQGSRPRRAGPSGRSTRSGDTAGPARTATAPPRRSRGPGGPGRSAAPARGRRGPHRPRPGRRTG